MKKGLLIVVSAPAGCGKDTVLEQVMSKNDNLSYSVSATTRNIRPNETDGVHYFFKGREEFEQMIAQDAFLEYAQYNGNYYGTPKKAVLDRLEAGKDVILKIEVQGAANIKRLFPECVMIFLLPPSMSELSRRLHKRGTETEEVINERLSIAQKELTYAAGYDYAIVNGELSVCVDDFLAVVRAEKLSVRRSKVDIERAAQ